MIFFNKSLKEKKFLFYDLRWKLFCNSWQPSIKESVGNNPRTKKGNLINIPD